MAVKSFKDMANFSCPRYIFLPYFKDFQSYPQIKEHIALNKSSLLLLII
jgi:hypothetical protein